MKSAVLVAAKTIEIQERPLPEPGPGEVRVKLGVVGVCGSDVHYYAHGRIGTQITRYPTLLGHEPAGVVDKVGPGVALEEGTRVAIEPAIPCMDCEFCREGRYNNCPHVKFLGTPPTHGIFEQYHCMPAVCCVPIPDSMTLLEAALLEPLGVALHAIHLAKLRLGETVAIFGGGPIGLVTLLCARFAGAGQVFLTDLLLHRLDMAKQLGADAVLQADQGNVGEWIQEQTNGRGVDIAIECAGKQETITHMCEAARIGGRGYIIGIPEEDDLLFPMHTIRRKELLLQNVRRSNGEVEACLGLVASGRINLKPLATHFFPLEQVPEAFDLVLEHKDGVMRAMILPNADLKID